MMTRILILLCFLSSIAAAQSVGQYEIRKRGASGFTSYGVTLSNGQVIGQTAGVPAAITPFDGAFSSLSGIPANSSGVLTNNGSGTLSYTGTSTGGNGAGDNTKLVKFGTGGSVTGSQLNVSDGVSNTELGLSSLRWTSVLGGGFSTTLDWTIPTADRTITLPDATGTVITTGNLTSITTTGTITSGTWQGGTIAVANGGTGASTLTANNVILGNGTSAVQFVAPGTSGNVLTSNGTTWVSSAPAGGGLTIGTTTITSGTSGRVLYNNAGVVGEMTTSGSGTQLALTNSPSFTTPTLGAATATTINGLTITSSTGTLTVNNGVTLTAATTGTAAILGANNFTGTQTVNSLSQLRSTGELQLQNSGASAGGALLYATSSFFTIGRADGANYTEVFRAALNAGSAIIGLWDGARFGNRIGFGAPVSAFGGTHTTDVWLEREAAATSQWGSDANADATDQIMKAADGITGTDRSGADLTLASGRGTGSGSASALIFSTPSALSTGTTAQTLTERARISSAGVTIGSGGSAISKVLTATASLDFGSIAAQSSADLTITVTGAAVGDAVIMGLPAAPDSGVVFNAFVSSSNTVTIRATNATSGAIDPASATFRATVVQH